jgi:hypothetical protein
MTTQCYEASVVPLSAGQVRIISDVVRCMSVVKDFETSSSAN